MIVYFVKKIQIHDRCQHNLLLYSILYFSLSFKESISYHIVVMF